MKKEIPAEVLINIATYLNQSNQKECCLLFGPLSDTALEEFAIASPHVHTLTLFINLLNQLSIPKTISVIQKYWLNSLVKIRMDELLLPKVLTLLSHQLEDVTGNYEGLFSDDSTGATSAIIPMPKLKVLDVEGDGEETILTAKILNDMRAAYPQLKKLTVSYFSFGSITEQEQAQLVPFPLVRSFHVLNCVDHDNHYPQITSMFNDLQEISFLRNTNMAVERASSRQYQYSHLVQRHRNSLEFNIDCLIRYHQIPSNIFWFASRAQFLTSMHLELPTETSVITNREYLDLGKIISILAHLKKLKIWGSCHVHTGESFELSGTVGYYDLEGYEDDREAIQEIIGDADKEDIGFLNGSLMELARNLGQEEGEEGSHEAQELQNLTDRRQILRGYYLEEDLYESEYYL